VGTKRSSYCYQCSMLQDLIHKQWPLP